VNAQNPNHWFPAKRYGWGWGPPITWQGWTVLVSWLIVFFAGVGYVVARHSLLQVPFGAAMAILLLVICYRKGEPPRWRWGKVSD
jgi:hypothetical protein